MAISSELLESIKHGYLQSGDNKKFSVDNDFCLWFQKNAIKYPVPNYIFKVNEA